MKGVFFMGKICKTDLPEPPVSKRVAAYVRVSLETDRLKHSLAAQTGYFSELIRTEPGWEQAGIYSDSFISGTETSRRTGFRQLIADCEQGKIDVVLCKSISRFARNTVDLLETVRHLKELGVEVRFEKENINSLSADGELLLTILASFAQEESRSISENVKWGIRRRFQSGDAVMRNKRVFGYRYDGNRYIVQEDEAKGVRLIYDEYIGGVPLRVITEHINAGGFRTTRGIEFSHSQVNYIVHNEIYTGDILLQKTFVTDFITHSRAMNRGELPQYRLSGCHEAIIDTETFAKAQEESRRRASTKQVYCFSGMLICDICGKPFTRFSNNGKYVCWHCRKCDNTKLKEDKLKQLFGLSDPDISEKIKKIIVCRNGVLDAEFYDGRTEKWQYE